VILSGVVFNNYSASHYYLMASLASFNDMYFAFFVITCIRWIWYLVYLFAILSGLFLAEMSLDRLIAVRFPMVAVRYCTTSRAWKTVIVTGFVIALMNANVFYTYRYHRDDVLGK
jgi:hypothetical protein